MPNQSLQTILEETRDALAQKVREKNEIKDEENELARMKLISELINDSADRIVAAIADLDIKVPEITVPEVKIPQIDVSVPDIKVPEVVVNVPEIKIPPITVPTPEVTVNIPEKDMEETNKLLRDIIKKQPKNEDLDISVSLKLV